MNRLRAGYLQGKTEGKAWKGSSTACLSFSVSAQSFLAGYQGKPGFLMPLTHLGHNLRHDLGQHYGIYEQLSPNHNLFSVLSNAELPAKYSRVQLRRQGSGRGRLSAMKMHVFYVNIIWTICGRSV